MNARVSRTRAARGAVLVQTAVALIGLLAFGAFVIDYGVFWTSRGQAQNAADAAALAGAVALSYDDATDRTASGAAQTSARNVAGTHLVWSEAPVVTAITFPPCPDDGSDSCIRVDLERAGIQTFLARLVGVATQNVHATATAKAGYGNATECLKPWAVADRWEERRPVPVVPWSDTSTFDMYDGSGAVLPAPVDYYEAPSPTSFGTGFHPYNADMSFSDDYGRHFWLKLGEASNPATQLISSGWFMALDFGSGGSTYRDAIKGCVGVEYKVGDYVTTETGNMVGPTKGGVDGDADSLVNQDPGAWWNPALGGGRGGVDGSAFSVSPRIVPVVLFDIDEYLSRNPSGKDTIRIVNILGFFVVGMSGKDVEGYLCALPGKYISGSSSVGNPSSFLRTIQLVR